MYKQCRTEQSSLRQRQLEQGLLEMMIHQHFDEISVSDLCDHMGIPRKSFYRYFSSKEGALHALLDHAVLDCNGSVMGDDMLDMSNQLLMMERLFAYWKENRKLLDALARSGLSGLLIQRANDQAQRELLSSPFLVGEEEQIRYYGMLFMTCGLLTVIVQWHHDGFPQSAKQMAKIAMRLLNEPVLP